MKQNKRVLILGSTGGIGAACGEAFSKAQYELIGVARNEKPSSVKMKMIFGDLCDEMFRSSLVEIKPQIVIAAYGQYPGRSMTATGTINEFALSCIDLYEKFEATGTLEDFIVISSVMAQITSLPHAYTNEAHHQYGVAKRILSDFFRQTMLRMKSRSKIFLVEPGFIRSGFARIDKRLVERAPEDILTKANLEIIEPRSVAELIYSNTIDSNRNSKAVTIYNKHRTDESIC